MTLTQILQKIREAFYTKKEIDSMGGGGTSLSDTISQKANDSDVVHKSGDETISGVKTFNNNIKFNGDYNLCHIGNYGCVRVQGGTGVDGEGARLVVSGRTRSSVFAGMWELYTGDGNAYGPCMRGNPNGTLTWGGQPIQYASDQRLKQQIVEIDDKLLDAWEDVIQYQFKYNDAVDQKGDNARLHTGYVVQQIDEACKKHNIDISKYGLYCHEEYPEESEEIEIEQEDGTKIKERKVIREASEHYSLRYTETLVIECAYLKRENSRLKERLEKLEERLAKLENQCEIP